MTPELEQLRELRADLDELSTRVTRLVRASTGSGRRGRNQEGVRIDPDILATWQGWVARLERVAERLGRDYSEDIQQPQLPPLQSGARRLADFNLRARLDEAWLAFEQALPAVQPSEAWDVDEAFRAWETLTLVRAGLSHREAVALLASVPRRSATRRIARSAHIDLLGSVIINWSRRMAVLINGPEEWFVPRMRRVLTSSKVQVISAILIEADSHVASALPHPVCELSNLVATANSYLDAAKLG